MTLTNSIHRGLLIAALVSFMCPAAAHASVSLYIDLINEQDGDTFTMTAFGSATQDNCNEEPFVDVNVYIFTQPGNNLLASNSNSGTCSAQTSVSLSQTLTAWSQGDYEARVTSSGHGCASLSQNITAFNANYQLVHDNGNNSGAYSRCDTGSCLSLTFKTSGPPPAFIRAFILRVSFGTGVASCFGGSVQAIPSCNS